MSLFSSFWDSNERWLLRTCDLSMIPSLIIDDVLLYFISRAVNSDDQTRVYPCT